MTRFNESETDPVAAWLHRLAASEDPPASLPTAGQIWWRSQILERLEEEDARARRAARPAEWCRRLVGAVALAVILSALSMVLAQGAGGSGFAVPEPWLLVVSGLVLPLVAIFGVVAVLWRDA
jgi:hypothetical protein